MKLYPSSLNSVYMEWSLAGDYFNIYRSTSPEDDFDVIASFIRQPFYTDNTGDFYDENIRYYYKVEGYQDDGTLVSQDGPETLMYNTMDNIANKLIYEATVNLRVMNNPPVYFLLKKRVGVPCTECYNPVTKRPRYANCTVCNGTGYVGGYHPPLISMISQDVSQLMMASGEDDADKTFLTPISAWVLNIPLLYPEDVMVDVLNQRYKVVSVARRTKSQFVTRQILNLAPLEKGHPVYQIDVDRTVTFS